MHKNIKKNIIEMMSTINEAHEYIKSNITNTNSKMTIVQILSDCMNAASAILSLVVNSEGNEHITVACINDYCKSVKETADVLSDGGNIENVFTSMNDKLKATEDSVQRDISVKLEIVFLPYKSSMWDSLESIWKAANDDPDCDAYVVPIPYYDRNPDHSFSKVHYEGNDFPKDVPIVDYKKYDLSQRCPDIVFIHNPYDGNNFVTSVHPDYYTTEIKKYAKKLVYVPYFVLREPTDKEEPDFLNKISHFMMSPGVLNSDYVIVQSEYMRKKYLKVLLDQFKNNMAACAKIKRMILALGSPKYDKMTELIINKPEIPEKWQKIIKKPDGTNKKVVFYNTSLNSILDRSERALIKYCHVFKAFYKKRDEVALIWRPHPLTDATLNSMRPQLWNFYHVIMEDYVKEGWGIFDKTPNMDLALSLSDAYYGDDSSLIQLFRIKSDCVCIQWKIDEDEFIENYLTNSYVKTVEKSDFGKKIYLTIKEKLDKGEIS